MFDVYVLFDVATCVLLYHPDASCPFFLVSCMAVLIKHHQTTAARSERTSQKLQTILLYSSIVAMIFIFNIYIWNGTNFNLIYIGTVVLLFFSADTLFLIERYAYIITMLHVGYHNDCCLHSL